jgi:hypothetical protein
MGAAYNETSMPGEIPTQDVCSNFKNLQHEGRHQHGASYTGTFAEARGLKFPEAATFDSKTSASEFVVDEADKWGPALAVRYKDKESKERWLIGAWCSE